MSLQQSTSKTHQFLQQSEFSFEELESIDSLTSKFSRTSDILFVESHSLDLDAAA